MTEHTKRENIENAAPCGEALPHGTLYLWFVLALFYILFLSISAILGKITPVEARIAHLLPFLYSTYQHMLLHGMLFQLLALGLSWLVIKNLKLSNKEIGWFRPAGKVEIFIVPLIAGVLWYLIITLQRFYWHIIIDEIRSKHLPNAVSLLWEWPQYSRIWFADAITYFNVYAISLGLKTMILAPIMEEIVFRGVLFGALRRRLGILMVVFITSLLHVLDHYNGGNLISFFNPWLPQDIKFFSQLFPFMLVSLLAGYLRARYRTLLAPIIFHICCNILGWTLAWEIVIPH